MKEGEVHTLQTVHFRRLHDELGASQIIAKTWAPTNVGGYGLPA
jgi:hypothetical protein